MQSIVFGERRRILLVVLATFVLAVTYGVVTPLFEASDELWHYPFIQRLAQGQGLVEHDDPANPGPWRQEAFQPPLYYILGAGLTFWIDTSDLPALRTLNPHADIGVPMPDGNINMVVHDPAAEAFPWRGAALAMHIVRLLSAAMAAATVYAVYRFALEVFPGRADLALAAAAFTGFTPMFVFVGGVINNDNAVTLMCTLGLWQLARMVREPASPPRYREWIVLGVILGLAALSKTTGLGLNGLALIVGLYLMWCAWRRRSTTDVLRVVRGGVLAVAVLALVAGWWYARNWVLYGDPTGLANFLRFVGIRTPTPTVIELWNERWGFMAAYWGFFGGVNVLMDRWIYELLNTVAILCGIGAVVWLGAWTLRWISRRAAAGVSVRGLRPAPMPLLLMVAWQVIVVVGVERWAATTMASQGRLVYPAVACFSLWLAVGLSVWLPRRLGRAAVALAALGLAVLAAAAPFVWIAPAYAQPAQIDAASLPSGAVRVDAGFAGQLRLLGYRIETAEAMSGGSLALTLYWQVVAPPDRNWSVFVHVLDDNDVIIAQRDTYPGLGSLATARLTPGRAWADRYVIALKDTVYAPADARVRIGLYDLQTGTRALTGDGQDGVALGQVRIAARPGEVPNPLGINLDNQVELAGYTVDRALLRPGETLRLTLYWRALTTPRANYTVFAHILGEQDALWGQKDAWPQDGAAPTSGWQAGQLVEDTYDIVVKPDTPPGTYTLEVGMYLLEGGNFNRLRVLAADGRVVDTRILLRQIRVQSP